jgi:hypothetical protein
MSEYIYILRLNWHAIAPMWKMMSGRWFIFRESPQWVVVSFAAMYRRVKKDRSYESQHQDAFRFVKEAREELRARNRQARTRRSTATP